MYLNLAGRFTKNIIYPLRNYQRFRKRFPLSSETAETNRFPKFKIVFLKRKYLLGAIIFGNASDDFLQRFNQFPHPKALFFFVLFFTVYI